MSRDDDPDRTQEMMPVQLPSQPVISVRKRVLVVEPNVNVRFTRADELRAYHSVATAPSSDGALRLLRTERFDVVLVTEGQEGEGLALMEIAQRQSPTTRRFLLVAQRDPAHEAALASGLVHVLLEQPFDVLELLSHVDRGAAH